MAESWGGKERRRHPRVELKGEVRSRIHTVSSAPVINISLSGALVEVPCTLQPGTSYTLRLGLGGERTLALQGRVVRSYVHGFDRNDKGETIIKYRAAIHFSRMEDAQKRTLEELLAAFDDRAVSAELQRNRAV